MFNSVEPDRFHESWITENFNEGRLVVLRDATTIEIDDMYIQGTQWTKGQTDQPTVYLINSGSGTSQQLLE